MVWVVLLILAACSSMGPVEFRQRGDRFAKEFAGDLRRIETHADLEKARPQIRRHYNALAELIEEVAAWEKEHPGVKVPFEPTSGGDALFVELARVRELPGGKEILEDCQQEALRKVTRLR